MAARPKVAPAISSAFLREPLLVDSGAPGAVVSVSVMVILLFVGAMRSLRVAGDGRRGRRGQRTAEGVVEVDAGQEGLHAPVQFLVLQRRQHELVDEALLAVD